MPTKMKTTGLSFAKRAVHTLLLVPALASIAAAAPDSAEGFNAADLSYYRQVHAPVTKAWESGDGFVRGSGIGNPLFLPHEFGTESGRISMRLALEAVDGTGASVLFGKANHFGLDGSGRKLFVEGPAFGGRKAVLLGPATEIIRANEPFVATIEREDDQLRFVIDGKEIHVLRGFTGPLGQVGVRPHRSTMRVYGVSIEGMKSIQQRTGWTPPQESGLATFLGEPKLEIQSLFEGGRMPNVVVALDGTVIATWAGGGYKVRRSLDGGTTWEPESLVEEGVHGGGVTVDEVTGDVLIFVENSHPPGPPPRIYRSSDHGATWTLDEATVIHPLHRKASGHVPSMHMNEHGITLRFGNRRGRLLRATGNYMGGNIAGGPADAFCNAIYSDDGGRTWDTSAPFPAFGTNEAAVTELTDGRILFIARRHLGTDGLDMFKKHFAWSHDGGETWRDLRVSPVLPDGNTNSRYGLMHGLLRLPVHGRDILIFSNVESDTARERGTVWASFDGGETWPVKRLVDAGSFAYSSLAAGRAGTASEGWIYLQYEIWGRGSIARFNLSWMLAGEATGNGTIPDWASAPAP